MWQAMEVNMSTNKLPMAYDVADKTCKYSASHVATRECFYCGFGLCSDGSCGYKEGIIDYCNECWDQKRQEENGICKVCGESMEPVYENNGFAEPDPTKIEISGWKPCECERGESI